MTEDSWQGKEYGVAASHPQLRPRGCREFESEDVADAIQDTVPLSITMAEKVEAILAWGRTRARAAAGCIKGYERQC